MAGGWRGQADKQLHLSDPTSSQCWSATSLDHQCTFFCFFFRQTTKNDLLLVLACWSIIRITFVVPNTIKDEDTTKCYLSHFLQFRTCNFNLNHRLRSGLMLCVGMKTPLSGFRFSERNKMKTCPISFFQTMKMERFELYIGGRVESNSPFHKKGLSWELEICK